MSRFTDLFLNADVPQEPVVQQVVAEEPKVEEPVVEVISPKPVQSVNKPSLRRTHK